MAPVTKLQLLRLSMAVILTITLNAETLVYNGTVTAPPIIQCEDASTPCFIACLADGSCSNREVHCHQTAQQPCTIIVGREVEFVHTGRDSFYFTHHAPTVNITAFGEYALFLSVIYAHEALNSKLYLEVSGRRAFEGGTIFAPVGESSLLSIECLAGGNTCRSMRIYDDWTTEVHIEARDRADRTQIRNIFDDSPLNISRNDGNYIGLNSAYRASVFLSGFYTQSFDGLQYFGHNHGDWTLYGAGDQSFSGALIEATADIAPYNRPYGYNIKLIGTNTGDAVFSGFSLNASQCGEGPNIYAEVQSIRGLSDAVIYAKNANSVKIHCKQGGDCDGLKVECAHNNCTIVCDNDAQTDCSNMEIYTCSQTHVLCDGVDCNFAATKVFCGFNQNDTFYEPGNGQLLCTDYSAESCSNEYAEVECAPNSSPSRNPSHKPSLDPTEAPSKAPTKSPTDDPSQSPSIDPSRDPSRDPTISPFKEAEAKDDTTDVPNDNINDPIDPNDSVSQKIAVGLAVGCVLLCVLSAVVLKMKKTAEEAKEAEEVINNTISQPTTNTQRTQVPTMIKPGPQLQMGEMDDNDEREEDESSNNSDSSKLYGVPQNNTPQHVLQTPHDVNGVRDDNVEEGVNVPNCDIDDNGLYESSSNNMDQQTQTQTVQTPHDPLADICKDCGLMKAGKVCGEDGLFYCNDCWESYDYYQST
eukprot:500424_1